MQLISFKDDTGNTYWLLYDPCSKESKIELDEVSEKGWDVAVRADGLDEEELVSLKYFLEQYFK